MWFCECGCLEMEFGDCPLEGRKRVEGKDWEVEDAVETIMVLAPVTLNRLDNATCLVWRFI